MRHGQLRIIEFTSNRSKFDCFERTGLIFREEESEKKGHVRMAFSLCALHAYSDVRLSGRTLIRAERGKLELRFTRNLTYNKYN